MSAHEPVKKNKLSEAHTAITDKPPDPKPIPYGGKKPASGEMELQLVMTADALYMLAISIARTSRDFATKEAREGEIAIIASLAVQLSLWAITGTIYKPTDDDAKEIGRILHYYEGRPEGIQASGSLNSKHFILTGINVQEWMLPHSKMEEVGACL